jgi:D-alanyl-lipoteichoic acid acyltransferase DltB (MBOAT superfamily)
MNVGLILACRGFLLTLSLSFYAFQAMTYTIDIYRKDVTPSASYLDYLASVLFFPTALAGPITRVGSLLPQWKWKNAVLTGEEGGRALFLIGLGLAKKFLIADYLGNNLVNRVFDLPTLYSGGDVLVAVYAYAFQLYYDFSGYTDIAIGSALLLGIRLPANFRSPYRAANIADFWRRWHISFSNWLRDYLYFSLPGGRTRVMPYVSLVITMVLGGLWHGASWTFLVWGLLHGIGLAAFRLWQSMRHGRAAPGVIARVAGSLLTFHFVLLGWVFFRAASVSAAMTVLSQIASGHYSFDNTTPLLLIVLGIGVAGHFLPKSWYDGSVVLFTRTPAVMQAAALAVLTVAIRYVAATGAAPFIYTKF